MNTNFEKSISLKGVVNGTESGLVIRNNIKVDTKFSFSIAIKTWGDVVQKQDFNIAWYVNKPPTFPAKPSPIVLDVDYDNIRDGTDKNVFVFNSPSATDTERDQI